MEKGRLPENHYFDSDAEDREQTYPRWRKIVSAHCTMKDHRKPLVHNKVDCVHHYLGAKPGGQAEADKWEHEARILRAKYDASNAYIYSFLTLAVNGQQLDTIVLHESIAESDGRAAIQALDAKNQGKAIVDVLKTAQRLFNIST